MIRFPAESIPGSRMVGPGFVMCRIEMPSGFPHVDSPLASMFRVHDATSPVMPGIEYATLLKSLATTITRVSYHRQRFDFVLQQLHERRQRVGLVSGGDLLGKFGLFEATSMLGAARGAVDEIVYIAARRAGASEDDANDWGPYGLILKNPPAKRLVSEILLLRARNGWFSKLNDYRNALVHRGAREPMGMGYYPPGDTVAEARDPGMNAFLVPDRDSLQHQARPHLWTYNEGCRLEELVREVDAGFTELLHALGPEWGLALPAAGTMPVDDLPNTTVVFAKPIVAAHNGTLYTSIFTDPSAAQQYRTAVFPDETEVDVHPVRRCQLGSTPRFILHFVGGERFADALRRAGNVTADLKFVADPRFTPRTGAFYFEREIGSLSLEYIVAVGERGLDIDVLSDTFPTHDTVYVIREAFRPVT